jgi:hypothetical protein
MIINIIFVMLIIIEKIYNIMDNQKVIRISPELHQDFKNMCKANELTLSQGADTLIKRALKQGTFSEVKESVFKKIAELDKTFRSWMKQQEKTHLKGIADDIVVLSQELDKTMTRLKNVGTTKELMEINNLLTENFRTGTNEIIKDHKQNYESLILNYQKLSQQAIEDKKKISQNYFWGTIVFFVASVIAFFAFELLIKL